MMQTCTAYPKPGKEQYSIRRELHSITNPHSKASKARNRHMQQTQIPPLYHYVLPTPQTLQPYRLHRFAHAADPMLAPVPTFGMSAWSWPYTCCSVGFSPKAAEMMSGGKLNNPLARLRVPASSELSAEMSVAFSQPMTHRSPSASFGRNHAPMFGEMGVGHTHHYSASNGCFREGTMSSCLDSIQS